MFTYYVAGLAVGLLVHGIEGLPTQLGVAGHADEAVHVEDLVHGSAASALAHHVLSAAGTSTCGQRGHMMGIRIDILRWCSRGGNITVTPLTALI